ncbi:MAG: hypothetical protein R3B09_10495 [Nannocystaceae bacterium]
MRHIVLSTLTALTLLTGLTCTVSSSRAASTSTPHGTGREILIDGVHQSRTGKLAVKIYRTARGRIGGQMLFTDSATSTRVVFVIRDQVVYARGVVGNEPVRETHALSEFFDIDLSGARPSVQPAKLPKLSCPGLIGKIICAVGSEIVASCLKDGEFLGIKCGDAGDDGGTTGAQDDGEGTSTTG